MSNKRRTNVFLKIFVVVVSGMQLKIAWHHTSTTSFAETGSGPYPLLQAVWDCGISDPAVWCSAMWCGGVLEVSSSPLEGELTGSSWQNRNRLKCTARTVSSLDSSHCDQCIYSRDWLDRLVSEITCSVFLWTLIPTHWCDSASALIVNSIVFRVEFLHGLMTALLYQKHIGYLLWGVLIVPRGPSPQPRPKSVNDFLGLIIVSLFYDVLVLSPGPTWYISYSCGTV